MRSSRLMRNPVVLILRRVIGMICLFIGVLGLLLPILPGWPFIVPAIVLLGRRDRTLRYSHLWVRMALRFMRRHPKPSWRQIGQRLSKEYVSFKRMIVPKIDAAERAIGLA
jgi:hypothetical protein